MRFKYYKLTLRQMSLKKPFVFFITVIVTMLIFSLVINSNLKPTIKSLCEVSAKSIALAATNKAIEDNISNIKYTDLISFQKDVNGKVTTLNANVVLMNKLKSSIATSILHELNNYQEGEIQIPLGSFFGMKLIGGYGPKIKIKTIPVGDINVSFKSEFENAGINQTKHRIYVEVSTGVKILAPFYTDEQIYTEDITVAETIIVGDTPSQYYNINGLDVKDALNITN